MRWREPRVDKKTLRKIGLAAISGASDAEIERDSAKYFHVALAAMRAAHKAAKEWLR
jgi:hypothetical protein